MKRLSLRYLVLLPFFLSGCTTFQLQELKRTEPVGSPFHKELARYYLRFAEHEADDCDWSDSQKFAIKGLLAAYGKDITPEDPANWDDISPEALKELKEAREILLKALDFDTITLFPDYASRALFSYDCWVEEADEDDEKNIAACRDNFHEAIDAIAKERATPHDASPAPVTNAPAEPSPFNVTTTTYVVFFDKNSSTITMDGYKAVKQVASDLETISDYEVVIVGNAETTGTSPEYSEALAELRAETVRKSLIGLGINENSVIVSTSGEAPPTPPRKNRRVEIYVSH